MVGAQRARARGPGTVCVAEGMQRDSREWKGKRINPETHHMCCQVFALNCESNIFSEFFF